jgi:hypothetical protein
MVFLLLSSSALAIEVPVPRWEKYFRSLCNLFFIQVGANCGTNTCSGAGGRKDPIWSYNPLGSNPVDVLVARLVQLRAGTSRATIGAAQ